MATEIDDFIHQSKDDGGEMVVVWWLEHKENDFYGVRGDKGVLINWLLIDGCEEAEIQLQMLVFGYLVICLLHYSIQQQGNVDYLGKLWDEMFHIAWFFKFEQLSVSNFYQVQQGLIELLSFNCQLLIGLDGIEDECKE